MDINIYIIDKKGKKELFEPLIEHYKKLCRPWARVEIREIFNKEIAKAQERGALLAQKSYTKALNPFRGRGYDIVLDSRGEDITSEAFAELLRDRRLINFFIGGAYGLESSFISSSGRSVSFGRITLSHKLVKVVLMEQIFRGLSILHHHPYHK